MDCNWLKHNVFIIQNGKLVPRPNTPQKRKNYRYISYDPLNNPTPEDYFRQTISRLQKQNSALRNQLSQKVKEQNARALSNDQCGHIYTIRKYQAQISELKDEISKKQKQLNSKNQQLVGRDKRILQISNQNTKLHLKINSVLQQIQNMNKLMSKKDEQIVNKKGQLQQYCKTLERFTCKQKQQEKTMFSQNYVMTPKIEQKSSQQQDDYYSLQNNSMYNNECIIDRRFMTPEIQSFRRDELNHPLYRTQQQISNEQIRKLKNTKKQNISNKQHGQAILNDFRSSMWGNYQKPGNIAYK